jgi:thymidylate synthase (FAD)
MTVNLIHHGDEAHLLYIARVSSNQDNADPGLINYLMRNGHWSPFEMIGACVEINTTRDIGRQILRHRSFSYQEFSQRYAEVADSVADREMRLAGSSNRQGSTGERDDYCEEIVNEFAAQAFATYQRLLNEGVAPECARAVLPEGLTPTRLYMHGTLRSWLHYLKERLHVDPKRGVQVAQREHVLLAEAIYDELRFVFPTTFAAVEQFEYIDRHARERLA